MGLFPLLPGMPVRITQTLPELRPYHLFKNTRGRLWDWCLAEQDRAPVATASQAEVVVQAMPKAVFVQVLGATWQHHPSLPPGVAQIKPTVQHWPLHYQQP